MSNATYGSTSIGKAAIEEWQSKVPAEWGTTQEVLSVLVRHGTASGSYLIAYSLLQHENHHLVKTFFSLNRKVTNQ